MPKARAGAFSLLEEGEECGAGPGWDSARGFLGRGEPSGEVAGEAPLECLKELDRVSMYGNAISRIFVAIVTRWCV